MPSITLVKENKTLVIQTVTLAPSAGAVGWKDPVRAATTGNITLAGLQTIDGVALAAGNRVLVKSQTLGQQNGIYVAGTGAWLRAADADSDAEVPAAMVVTVAEGLLYADTLWILQTDAPIVVGTTALTFRQLDQSTGLNVGTGAGVYKDNQGVALRFRSLVPGAGIGITENADEIEIRSQVFDWKESVRAATTVNIALSGLQTIDDVVLVVGDRVLVKDQTVASENGIYTVAAGAWARSADADTSLEVTPGLVTGVEEGSINQDTAWMLVTDSPLVLGTTDLTFAQFGGGGTAGTLITETVLTYPIDHNLVGAALIPTGTTFINQGDIDAFLLIAGTTHFKYVMDCWDATPKVLAHNVVFNLEAGIHRARPTDPLTAVFNLVGKVSLGGSFSMLGAPSSTWDQVLAPLTVASVTAAPDPGLTFAGTPFTGLDLRGLHVVLSTGQVGVIHDHDNSTLKVTANLSPSPVGGTATVARPSTILRNSDNDIVHRTTSPTLRFGLHGGGVGHTFSDLRIDTFSGSSAAWALLVTTPDTTVSAVRILNDYDIQFTAFGRVPDGRTFQLNGSDDALVTSLCAVKAPSTSGAINEFVFGSGRCVVSLTDTVLYNPRQASAAIFLGFGSNGSALALNKVVIHWITLTTVGAIDISELTTGTFFDGFGLGTFCQIRAAGIGLALRGRAKIRSDRSDTAIKFRNTIAAAIALFDRAEANLSAADGSHGLLDDGGNLGVGIDVNGPYALVNLNAASNVTGALGNFRFAGVIDTYANLVANGPYTDDSFNFLDKA